jgi:hypothetical protein
MADDKILSLEDAWRLYLDEHFGDITTREAAAIARYYARLKLTPPFEASRELLRRYRQCGGDIVHGGWDEANDFSTWTDAFKLLAPPRGAGGKGRRPNGGAIFSLYGLAASR